MQVRKLTLDEVTIAIEEKAAGGAARMRRSDDLVHMAREHMESLVSKPGERG